MSAVDVRHAIAQADLALGTAGLRPDNILRRELRAVGAAVAELIEADQELDAARNAYLAAIDGPNPDAVISARNQLREAARVRSAALAHCGGAP